MDPMRKLALALAVAALAAAPAGAVILDDENYHDFVLSDGTQVRVIGEAITTLKAAPTGGTGINVKEMAEAAVGGFENPKKLTKSEEEKKKEEEAKAKNKGGTKFTTRPVGARRPIAPLGPPLTSPRSNRFYYLPTNLHLSKRPDGTPEFLFLKFTSEERADQGGVSGGLLHFLMEWGLTAKQEAELAQKLKAKVKNGQLMGAAPMEAEGETGSFQIVSATLSDQSMAPSVVTSGKAPLLPGGKVAAASRLTATGAQLLAATFEKSRSITDVSIALNFSYTTLTPAARGAITFDWSKFEAERERLHAEYTKEYAEDDDDAGCVFFICWWIADENYDYSYQEMAEHYQYMLDKKIVTIDWMETVDSEKLNKIREAFFDYFVQALANPVDAAPPAEEGAQRGPNAPPIPEDARRYTYDRQALSGVFKKGIQYFPLNVRLPVKHSHQVVGNLASWYNQVQNNPKCVASVNLNDPFFQHRDIHFILDLDAKEMFDEAVNYVTVNVRKPRTGGQPFEDHVTIDAKHVTEKGINATVTYARGEDKNPDVYQYQTQWSLKGGHVYPRNPAWQVGSWEGVTLAPPVVPRTIEVEGDLEAMTANDITRVTVQVHYPKFGEEVEENIHLSPAKGEALVAEKIFLDRGAKGYAYRLVVNHKTEGKLALPWSAQVADDYIYASIPEDLLKEDSPLKKIAKEAAIGLAESAKEKVLDKFKELLSGGSAGGGS
jgi:hypothetical protein